MIGSGHRPSHLGKGFTIVELLIVIVVIGILAAITIVAFNGVQQRARVAAMQSDLTNSAKQLENFRLSGTNTSEAYPATLAEANTNLSQGNTANYLRNTVNNTYCLDITNSGQTYYITSLSSTPQQGDCNVTNGLVGRWLMNGNANDSVGSSNGTVPGSVTLTAGQNGANNAGYAFTGTSITTTSTALPTGSSARTVLVWAYLTQYWNGGWRMADTWGSSSTGNASALSVSTDGRVSYNGGSNDYQSNFIMPLNQWHLIGYTLDGRNVSIFFNDQKQSSTVGSTPATLANQTHHIGAWGNASFGWVGRLDDTRIYNRVLSDEEIKAVYAGGAR